MGPGRPARPNGRAPGVERTNRVRPRKLGNVVIGSRDQEASQRFFTQGGRAFCLYVVLGSWVQRGSLVPLANSFLSTVQVVPR